MGSGRIALEGVDEAIACDGVRGGSGGGSGGFGGAGYRKGVWNVESEGGGVAVGGIVGEREPARGEKKESAVASNGRGTNAGDRAVFFVGQRTGIRESESDFAGRGHRCGQVDDEDQGILGVALEAEGLTVGGLDVGYVEVGMELDADGTGDFAGLEIDFSYGGEGVRDGIEGGGDVVMGGEEGGRRRGVGPE